MWFLYCNKFNAVMEGEAEGYSHWYGMYHERPGYILQSDFSYMISPAMFKTFVAPDLSSSADRLHNAVYHLDGIGEIPHLDTILAMEGVKGVQWVPGAGDPEKQLLVISQVTEAEKEEIASFLNTATFLVEEAERAEG